MIPESLRPGTPTPESEGWRRTLRRGEDLLVTLALVAMMLVPLAHALLRKLFDTGITGASTITQSLVLIVGALPRSAPLPNPWC